MAYRGLGNQRLGAAADLASVLETLYIIEHEEAQSDERKAMEYIREDMATKRQKESMTYQAELTKERDILGQEFTTARDKSGVASDAIVADTKFNRDVIALNAATLHTWDKNDLTSNLNGILEPKQAAIPKKDKRVQEDKLEAMIGRRVEYDDPQFNAYMKEYLAAARYSDQPRYIETREDADRLGLGGDFELDAVDYSPGHFTEHDFDVVLRQLETESGVRKEKAISLADSEGKSLMFPALDEKELSLARTAGLYTSPRYTTSAEYSKLKSSEKTSAFYAASAEEKADDAKRENIEADKEYLIQDYVTPIFNKVHQIEDIGLTYTDNYQAFTSALYERIEHEYGDEQKDTYAPGKIEQYKSAAREIFENQNLSTREFLSAFKKWDKPTRTGRDSIAKELMDLFGASVHYDAMNKLTSEYKDVGKYMTTPVKDHFQWNIKQETAIDNWELAFPSSIEQIDKAVQAGLIVLKEGIVNNKKVLTVLVKDSGGFKSMVNAWVKASKGNTPQADNLRRDLLFWRKKQQSGELIVKGF